MVSILAASGAIWLEVLDPFGAAAVAARDSALWTHWAVAGRDCKGKLAQNLSRVFLEVLAGSDSRVKWSSQMRSEASDGPSLLSGGTLPAVSSAAVGWLPCFLRDARPQTTNGREVICWIWSQHTMTQAVGKQLCARMKLEAVTDPNPW